MAESEGSCPETTGGSNKAKAVSVPGWEDGAQRGWDPWGSESLGAPGNFQAVGGGTLEARLSTFPEFQHHLDPRSQWLCWIVIGGVLQQPLAT